ncbi:MAG: hypothetical protein AAF493_21200 [Pseudomonadota bacterium]
MSEPDRTRHSTFHNYVLGEHEETLALETSDANREVLLAMLAHGSRSVDIICRDLDRVILNHLDVYDALVGVIKRGSGARVRCLVRDAGPATQRGHFVVNFARRFSSFCEIRQLSETHRQFNDAFTVVDGIGVIFRGHAARYEAHASFSDRKRARDLTRLFETMWETATVESNLRAFII